MTNFQIHRKLLSFSFVSFLVDMLCLAIVVGGGTLGFFIMNRQTDLAILGLIIGAIIGALLIIPISIFVSNRIKAAQIAMMTKAVTEGKLPDHAFHAGFEEIRGRFVKITVFFAITNAIKGIFRQLGRTMNQVGTAVGGNTGNAITSGIDAAIQTLIGYLCDCCLGWIMYRNDINPFKAGCEGAAIFFKHGKTLIRNVGRIFGMGILSLLLIGGAFFGILYLIFSQFPKMFEMLSSEIVEIAVRNNGEIPEIISNPTFLTLVVCGILALIIWGCIHSVLIRPFILIGVLRNFMAAGQKDIPSEKDFAMLAEKSPKFVKLQNKIQ